MLACGGLKISSFHFVLFIKNIMRGRSLFFFVCELLAFAFVGRVQMRVALFEFQHFENVEHVRVAA